MTVEKELIEEIPSVSVDDAEQEQKAERQFSSSEVTKIVERERKKAYEKAQRELKMTEQEPNVVPQSQISAGGMNTLTPDDLRKMLREELPNHLQDTLMQQRHQQTVNNFVEKMQVAEQKYPGLEAELNQLNFSDPATSALVVMATNLDNTGDVIKDLIDNPEKFSSLLSMIDRQPHLAAKRLYDLSSSIKKNQQALEEKQMSQEPLSKLKPSSLSNQTNDKQATVTDFRKMLK